MLRLASKEGPLTGDQVEGALGVSRATARRVLKALVDAGSLTRLGSGRATRYVLAPRQFHWPRPALDEHEAWKQIEPVFAGSTTLSPEELRTVNYCVTEMLNNAHDHSAGANVDVAVRFARGVVEIEIVDDGVGVFERIRDVHGLATLEDAVVQLEKGKLTSAPDRHSGEGIFFTSKAVARFRLESDGLAWLVDNEIDDRSIVALERRRVGTRVVLELVPGEVKPVEQVFAPWTGAEGGFTTTRTTVKLLVHGDTLISRSEAKRAVSGLERFREVLFDFEGVTAVGQGFVDEVFRVFAVAHPAIRLRATNMSPAVAFMVSRARPRLVDDAEARAHLSARYRVACARLDLLAHCTSKDDAILLATSAAFGVLRVDGGSGDGGARFNDIVEPRLVGDLGAAWALAERSLRLDDVALAETLLWRVETIARGIVERIAERRELWTWFDSDDHLAAFWALDGAERRRLWGPRVAVAPGA